MPRVSKVEVQSGGDPEADAFVDAAATSTATPYLLLTTLSIHSLIAGVALGTDEEQSSFLVLLIAILAHKGSAGFALGTTFQRAGMAVRRALPALLFFACSTSVGVVLGLFADIAFDAGSMHVGRPGSRRSRRARSSTSRPSTSFGRNSFRSRRTVTDDMSVRSSGLV